MSIQGPNSLAPIASALATPLVAPYTPTLPPRAEPAATASVSPWAELLNKLQRLKQQDPAAFGTTVAHMADTVRTAAGQATGDAKQAMVKLADQLTQVAKTGDVSVFKPSKPRHPHHAAHAATALGGMEPLFDALLEQVDHVLGPGATSPLSP